MVQATAMTRAWASEGLAVSIGDDRLMMVTWQGLKSAAEMTRCDKAALVSLWRRLGCSRCRGLVILAWVVDLLWLWLEDG
ncbi:hypothetical protein M0R45_002002 [Rubus argutus]|uniref:Uncharacterized protein n=1 Tax=Rubus argutus TaxID=59490 RepID=A0AAW1VDM0_RUBAR